MITILACDCNAFGSKAGTTCDQVDGACTCIQNVAGQKCDECTIGFYDFPNCKGRHIH